MERELISKRQIKWLVLMTVLFLVSLGIFSQSSSLFKSNPEVSYSEIKVETISSERAAKEGKVEMAVEEWNERLEKLKAEIRASTILSKRRSRLKKIYRELVADRRLLKKDLLDLRRASDSQWEHLADHLEAELDLMNQKFNGRLAE
jgi:predicted enzyme involved in methoxymalonyl-ACP biosynthesis